MGASVNERDKYGLTPLHHAAMRGNVKEVEQLVDCGGIDIEVSEKSLCNWFICLILQHVTFVQRRGKIKIYSILAKACRL